MKVEDAMTRIEILIVGVITEIEIIEGIWIIEINVHPEMIEETFDDVQVIVFVEWLVNYLGTQNYKLGTKTPQFREGRK